MAHGLAMLFSIVVLLSTLSCAIAAPVARSLSSRALPEPVDASTARSYLSERKHLISTTQMLWDHIHAPFQSRLQLTLIRLHTPGAISRHGTSVSAIPPRAPVLSLTCRTVHPSSCSLRKVRHQGNCAKARWHQCGDRFKLQTDLRQLGISV